MTKQPEISDILTETRLSLTELAKQQGRSTPTVWRWANTGVGSPRIKLETVRIGGRRFTSQEAFRRFVEKRNTQPTDDGPERRTNRRREAAIRAAERRLHGVK